VDSSTPFLDCRIDWRPSRLLAAAQLMAGLLAALALPATALPLPLAVAASVTALVAATVLALHGLARPGRCVRVRIDGDGSRVWLDGRPVSGHAVHLRAGLAVLALRLPGRRLRLGWYPDTLSAGARRTFRLLKRGRAAPPTALPLLAG